MLQARPWVPEGAERFIQAQAQRCARQTADENERDLLSWVTLNRDTHEHACINLNPATNTMSPRAESMLAASIAGRPSLGYPGAKYEMGLEAIEKMEVLAAELAAQAFGARYVEVRAGSGVLANLFAYMALARPGDTVFVPAAEVAGHVSHHRAGAAGLYGLHSHVMRSDPVRYSVDLDALREDARRLRPRLIVLGSSLNLFPHPVREARAIADEVGAHLLYDAAHVSGLIAGRAWQQPLQEGAHLMTMSTYKSLAGPPGGLVLTNDADVAQRVDAVAYPGLTANFDAARCAALAVTLMDWQVHGRAFAAEMLASAHALVECLLHADLPLYARDRGVTASHQFALEAGRWGGGQTLARLLRRAHILSSGIGLPVAPVEGDLNGLRLGTSETARWGLRSEHMPPLAIYLAMTLQGRQPPEEIAPAVSAFRRQFDRVHFVR